ncbi:MAG TPA: lytic transglycosylase domain-containing protein [Jatrophihabitans sp.]|nr:lytic transglycosylase domain-containing protein [Jatrophihabitans sp.]
MGGLALLVGFVITAGAAVAGGPLNIARAAAPPSITGPADGASGTFGIAGLATSSSMVIITGSGTPVVFPLLPSTSATQQLDQAPVSALAASGIPVTALNAYQAAASREATRLPDCGLTWPLLAGIGRVESDHGRFAGAILHSDGLSTPPVIGIPLNGNGTALITDTDGGALDGDTVYDRAVGPMQFIPSTWAGWGVDANGDGVKDPFNIFDAAAAAADYLCAGGRDLTTTHDQAQAILSYNYSWDYVRLVMSLERVYARGVGLTVPVLPTSPEPKHGRPAHKPKQPPVDPGTPRGASPPGSTSPSPSKSPTRSSSSTSPKPSYTRPSGPLPTSSLPSPTPTSSSSSPSPPDTSSSSGTSSTGSSSATNSSSGASGSGSTGSTGSTASTGSTGTTGTTGSTGPTATTP